MARENADQLEQAVTGFFQAARLLDVLRLHVWDERGLTLPQLRILFRLRLEPGLGVKELAQAFEVSASNITQQVDKLVARGLVARVERPLDRRQVTLTLTAEGEQAAGEISHTARSYLRGLLAQLSEDDLHQLSRIHRQIVALAAPPSPTPAAVAAGDDRATAGA